MPSLSMSKFLPFSGFDREMMLLKSRSKIRGSTGGVFGGPASVIVSSGGVFGFGSSNILAGCSLGFFSSSLSFSVASADSPGFCSSPPPEPSPEPLPEPSPPSPPLGPFPLCQSGSASPSGLYSVIPKLPFLKSLIIILHNADINIDKSLELPM